MNLKGGYKILLLPVMEIDEDSVTITDKGLLEQLSTLKTYMGKKELKPMLLHCEIEKDSTITKHCVMGELKKISDTEYVIIGKIDNAYLTISVEFTQDEETGEYYIASGDATYILSETTKIGDLVVDGDITAQGETKGKITARILKQNEANYVYPLSIEGITFPEGINASLIYGRLEEINGVLYFVSSIEVENTTSSAINISDSEVLVTLPSEIASKIFDILGKPVSEAVSNSTLITEIPLYKSNQGGTATSAISRISNKTTANVMGIRVISSSTINANDIQYFTARTFLTLL